MCSCLALGKLNIKHSGSGSISSTAAMVLGTPAGEEIAGKNPGKGLTNGCFQNLLLTVAIDRSCHCCGTAAEVGKPSSLKIRNIRLWSFSEATISRAAIGHPKGTSLWSGMKSQSLGI